MKNPFRKINLFVLLIASVAGQVSAQDASWIGQSYIVAAPDGGYLKWFNASGSGQTNSFDNYDFGTISSLKLTAQLKTTQSDAANNLAQIGYKFDDNGVVHHVDLAWVGYNGNNNVFGYEPGSPSWRVASYIADNQVMDIDISGLAPGQHTISVWFRALKNGNNEYVWDSNNSNNYKAKFTTSALKATQALDGLFWSTFYRNDANFEIDANENACAYTATVNGSDLMLHYLGKVIPQGTAVIIVGEDASISMTAIESTSVVASGNALQGVDVRTKCNEIGSGIFYVLGNDDTDGLGFYKYSGEYMPAHKAFLLTTNAARGFTIEFEGDGTTGIRTINNASIDNGIWYSLDGRKFSSKPSQRGVYINNGKKVIIK